MNRPWYKKWYVYALMVIGVVIVCDVLILHVFQYRVLKVRTFSTPAGSMKPTLVPGDHFLARLDTYSSTKPQRGDVVVFPYPKDTSQSFVKRIVGLENEKIEIRAKKVYVNDTLLNEPYAQYVDRSIMPTRDNYGPTTVPQGSVFVMGDNRDESLDSRFWGFVRTADIEGKAAYIYLSNDWGRIGKRISP